MAHKLNEENLRNYLRRIFNQDGALHVKKFKDGQSNPTFYLKYGDKELVLRKKPHGKLLPGAHQVGREYRVMRALHTVGFLVPRVIAHCTDASVIGTEFFIMEYMEGTVYMNGLPGSSTEDVRECVFSAVETLAKLHSISPVKIGLQDYGKASGYCGRQVNTWRRQYEAAKHKTIPEMDQLADWLRNNIPPDVRDPSIVHGDYSLQNLMFHSGKNQVKCVLDWELSTIGHPLCDLAYLCNVYHMPKEQFQMMFGAEDTSGLPTEEEVLTHYCRVRDVPYPLKNWNFFQALSCFKLASIIQGVYARFLLGNASSTRAHFFEKTIQPMAAVGLKLALR